MLQEQSHHRHVAVIRWTSSCLQCTLAGCQQTKQIRGKLCGNWFDFASCTSFHCSGTANLEFLYDFVVHSLVSEQQYSVVPIAFHCNDTVTVACSYNGNGKVREGKYLPLYTLFVATVTVNLPCFFL